MRLVLFSSVLLLIVTLTTTQQTLPELAIYSVQGSPANQHILAQNVSNSLKPFFWNGDTPWLLYHGLKFEDVEVYLDDRVAKKFNVVQTQRM